MVLIAAYNPKVLCMFTLLRQLNYLGNLEGSI